MKIQEKGGFPMYCPNCGFYNEETDTYCSHCRQPVGNATYTMVEERAGKGVIVFFTILGILLLLSVLVSVGAGYYIRDAEKECKASAKLLMSVAQNQNFSDFPVDTLPEKLSYITKLPSDLPSLIDDEIEKNDMEKILDHHNVKADYDTMITKIKEDATYTIDDISVRLNQCDITITTSNYNYPVLINTIKEQLPPLSSQEDNNEDWWSGISHWITGWMSTDEESGELPSTLSGWINRVSNDAQASKITGTLHYQLTKEGWILTAGDINLFYNLYGFPMT